METDTPQKLSVPGRKKPYVMAHRGNRALCPENTLASFQQAIQDGADILETDLHLSKDGHFMCIHDETIDRTTDGSGKVAEMTLAELKQFSAFYGKTGFENERIPTLAEVAAILPENVALALELKTDRFLEDDICQRLADELQASGIRNRCLVISFSKDRVKKVHHVARDIPAGWITLSSPQVPEDMTILGPFWPLLLLNPFYVRRAHRNGQIVCPLDPFPDSRLWFYRLLHVDAVLSDNPQKTCQKLKKYT